MPQDNGANPALVPTASSQQAVSTKGFDHGEVDAEAGGRLRASRNFAHNGIARVLVKDLDALLGEYSDTAGKRLADAQLYAAAPDLYEALKTITENLIVVPMFAEAALAKARGEA